MKVGILDRYTIQKANHHKLASLLLGFNTSTGTYDDATYLANLESRLEVSIISFTFLPIVILSDVDLLS